MNGKQLWEKLWSLDGPTPITDLAESLYWPRHHDAWFGTRRMQWLFGQFHIDKFHNAADLYHFIDVTAMLLWLAEASGVEEHILKKAIKRAASLNNPRARCNAIRKAIPWRIIERNLERRMP